jgi:DNA polymerase III subunit beta
MNVIVKKDIFLNSLVVASRVITSKPILEVLTCMLLKAKDNKLTVSCTNLSVGIEHVVDDAEIEEEGTVAVNAKLLIDIVRSIDDDEICLSIRGGSLCLEFGFSSMIVPCSDVEKFPMLPAIENIEELECVNVEQSLFKKMINDLSFMVAYENNANYCNVFLEVKGGYLSVFALEAGRMSFRCEEVKSEVDFSIAIPTNDMYTLVKMLNFGELKIYHNDNLITLMSDEFKVVSRLSNTKFFKAEKFINKENDTSITVTKEPLYSIFKRCLIIGRTGKTIVQITFDILQDKMVVRCSSQLGALEEPVDIETGCDKFSISFNPIYWADIFKNIDDEEMLLEFDSKKQSLFYIRHKDKKRYVYLIAPTKPK